MTSIVLADDHHVVRQALRILLESEPGLQVVGEAGDGRETIQLVEREQPDVLIVDLMMPCVNGLDVTRQVRKRTPRTRVVILSMHADEAYVVEALRLGASAFVLKESTSEELLKAIRDVAAGGRYLSPPLSDRAIDAYIQRSEEHPIDETAGLTPREREILYLAAEGQTSAEIAARLVISPRTVETHRGNLMRKLGLHSQAELVRYALQRGLLPVSPPSTDEGDRST